MNYLFTFAYKKRKMHNKLFNDFPPISTKEWEELIQKDLKGGDYERKLVWKPIEGFSVKPYYRQEDLTNLEYLDNIPGEFPYTRGASLTNNWKVRQDIIIEDCVVANRVAIKAIENGVDSLGFIFNDDISYESFVILLKDIDIKEIEINFVTKKMNTLYLDFLYQYANDLKIDFQLLKGSNNCDRLSYRLLNGFFLCEKEQVENIESMLLKYHAKLPSFTLLTIDAKHFHNSGSSIVQELGFAIAMGAEYFKILLEKNISAELIAKTIKFNFAVGSNYFMEIAKLRAIRYLWSKIMEANNVSDFKSSMINIHCETSNINKTIYDPHVNILRATTEAMSAVLGGTSSLCVGAFDTAYNDSNEFSTRIARNLQLIIKEEAHFDKVIDPAGGSYYIENLTNELINKAWNLFLEIEDKGGFLETIKVGFIQEEINKIAKLRNSNIATRKEILLGTNQYPNFNEIKDVKSIEKNNQIREDNTDSVIKPYRLSEDFEKLRLRTDAAKKRPVVFMLTIGNLNMRKARAQFSCNFFACAGFEVVDNNGFNTIDEGIIEANKQKADIIVLCSSDEEYEVLAIETYNKLTNKILVIAGLPQCKEILEKHGISNYIHVKSNVLEELTKYQKLLKIS